MVTTACCWRVRSRWRSIPLTFLFALIAQDAFGGFASFQGLGNILGPTHYGVATGVSADGRIVVGEAYTLNNVRQAYRWTEETGMVALPTFGDFRRSRANNISPDGSVIVGFEYLLQSGSEVGNAVIWTTGGISNIGQGPLASAAMAVSTGGTVVVGQRGDFSASYAYRWSSSAGSGNIAPSRSYAIDVSADGKFIAGTRNSSQAFRYSDESGYQLLTSLVEATAISADGSVVTGVGLFGNMYGMARWTPASGTTPLVQLRSDHSGRANDVSADGRYIVGQYGPFNSGEAFLWDEANGLRTLRAMLIDYGLGADIAGWRLTTIDSISDDGTTFVGDGINPDGITEAFRAVIPEPGVVLIVLPGAIIVGLRRRGPGCGALTRRYLC